MEAVMAAEFLGASARETLQLPDCGLVGAPEHRRRICEPHPALPPENCACAAVGGSSSRSCGRRALGPERSVVLHAG